MSRPIKLAVFSNGKKPAHWAIFVPNTDDALIGKIIHVTGNPATGFFLEFKRGYNFADTNRKFELIDLAAVKSNVAFNAPEGCYTDTIARDQLESFATTVQPPGRSPNPFDPQAPNCQNWIIDYVRGLKERDLVPEDAITVVQNAPRFLTS